MSKVLVYVFGDNSVAELGASLGARFVHRMSSDIADLRLIVEYGVVEPVCVVVVRDGSVVARIPRAPSFPELMSVVTRAFYS